MNKPSLVLCCWVLRLFQRSSLAPDFYASDLSRFDQPVSSFWGAPPPGAIERFAYAHARFKYPGGGLDCMTELWLCLQGVANALLTGPYPGKSLFN